MEKRALRSLRSQRTQNGKVPSPSTSRWRSLRSPRTLSPLHSVNRENPSPTGELASCVPLLESVQTAKPRLSPQPSRSTSVTPILRTVTMLPRDAIMTNATPVTFNSISANLRFVSKELNVEWVGQPFRADTGENSRIEIRPPPNGADECLASCEKPVGSRVRLERPDLQSLTATRRRFLKVGANHGCPFVSPSHVRIRLLTVQDVIESLCSFGGLLAKISRIKRRMLIVIATSPRSAEAQVPAPEQGSIQHGRQPCGRG